MSSRAWCLRSRWPSRQNLQQRLARLVREGQCCHTVAHDWMLSLMRVCAAELPPQKQSQLRHPPNHHRSSAHGRHRAASGTHNGTGHQHKHAASKGTGAVIAVLRQQACTQNCGAPAHNPLPNGTNPLQSCCSLRTHVCNGEPAQELKSPHMTATLAPAEQPTRCMASISVLTWTASRFYYAAPCHGQVCCSPTQKT